MAVEEEFAIEIPDQEADAINAVNDGECLLLRLRKANKQPLSTLPRLVIAPSPPRSTLLTSPPTLQTPEGEFRSHDVEGTGLFS